MNSMRPLAIVTAMAVLPMHMASGQTVSMVADEDASRGAMAVAGPVSYSPSYQLWHRHPASQLWADFCTSGNCKKCGPRNGPHSCAVPCQTSPVGNAATDCNEAAKDEPAACSAGQCQRGRNCSNGCVSDLLNLFGLVLCSDTHGSTVCSNACGSNACGSNSYVRAVPSSGGAQEPVISIAPVHIDPPVPKPQSEPTSLPAIPAPPRNEVPKNTLPKKVGVPHGVDRSNFLAPDYSRTTLRLSDFIKL